jgi:tRNA(adenine34) deaminase
MDSNHEHYMQMALQEALRAQEMDEVPIGAVLVGDSGRILAAAHNETIARCDPTAHAEILTLREAADRIGNYRLLGSAIYVTVEPCVMCMGAIIHARVGRVVYGAPDPKWGALGSIYDFANEDRFNHRPEIVSGICADRCRRMMVDFFARRR